MSVSAVLTGPATVHAVRGARREVIRAAVRARIDDSVLTAQSRTEAAAVATLIGEQFGRVVECACDNLGSVDDLTTQLRSGGVALVIVTGAADIASIIALTNHVHRYGARIAVDATDIIARQPFSVVSHGIDVVITDADVVPGGEPGALLIGRSDWLSGADDHAGGRR